MNISSLPSVACSNVLSHLSWEEKLHAVDVLPCWTEALCCSKAWPQLEYIELPSTKFLKRIDLCKCISAYGRYILRIRLCFHHHLEKRAAQIFREIAEHCWQLTHLEARKCHVWSNRSEEAFCDILVRCPKLDFISLVKPTLVWTEGEENILTRIVALGQAHKIKELILSNESLVDHEGSLDILGEFKGVMRLKTRREELSEETFLELAKYGHLGRLSIFQDEEIPLVKPPLFSQVTWQSVLQSLPSLRLTLILRNIIVLRSGFPQLAPLRALVLVDLASTLTKGIVNTITQHYHNTLEIFVYSKSCLLGCAAMDDRRLPLALMDLAENCSLLHTLVYGFQISSTSVLLIAQARRLQHFSVLVEELSFDYDWQPRASWSPDFVKWLKGAGSSLEVMEAEVSRLMGAEWRVDTERHMWHYVHYYCNL